MSHWVSGWCNLRGERIDRLLILSAVVLSVSLLIIVMVKPYETGHFVRTLSDAEILVDDDRYTLSKPIQLTNMALILATALVSNIILIINNRQDWWWT